jgi:hypothetical protein
VVCMIWYGMISLWGLYACKAYPKTYRQQACC